MVELDSNGLPAESVQRFLWASIEVSKEQVSKGLLKEFKFVPGCSEETEV